MRKNLGNFEYQRSSTQMRPRPLLRERHKLGQRLEIGLGGCLDLGDLVVVLACWRGRERSQQTTGVKGLELVMRLSGVIDFWGDFVRSRKGHWNRREG